MRTRSHQKRGGGTRGGGKSNRGGVNKTTGRKNPWRSHAAFSIKEWATPPGSLPSTSKTEPIAAAAKVVVPKANATIPIELLRCDLARMVLLYLTRFVHLVLYHFRCYATKHFQPRQFYQAIFNVCQDDEVHFYIEDTLDPLRKLFLDKHSSNINFAISVAVQRFDDDRSALRCSWKRFVCEFEHFEWGENLAGSQMFYLGQLMNNLIDFDRSLTRLLIDSQESVIEDCQYRFEELALHLISDRQRELVTKLDEADNDRGRYKISLQQLELSDCHREGDCSATTGLQSTPLTSLNGKFCRLMINLEEVLP